jgi:glucose-6-phosphate 1-dehydrogenase
MAIFGAMGDLTPRYLLPAVARLHEAGMLPEGFKISCLARDDWGTGAFRGFVEARLAEHAADVAAPARSELVEMLEYHWADATDRERVAEVLGASGEPVVVYLALPPAVFAPSSRPSATSACQRAAGSSSRNPSARTLSRPES